MVSQPRVHRNRRESATARKRDTVRRLQRRHAATRLAAGLALAFVVLLLVSGVSYLTGADLAEVMSLSAVALASVALAWLWGRA